MLVQILSNMYNVAIHHYSPLQIPRPRTDCEVENKVCEATAERIAFSLVTELWREL